MIFFIIKFAILLNKHNERQTARLATIHTRTQTHTQRYDLGGKHLRSYNKTSSKWWSYISENKGGIDLLQAEQK